MATVYIPHGALVLSCDAGRARILRNRGTPLHVQLVTEQVLEQEDAPAPARRRPGQHLYVDSGRRAQEQFAAEIAAELDRMGNARTYENLIVVASAQMLGDLRAAFRVQVRSRVIAEVASDGSTQRAMALVNALEGGPAARVS